jgi:hypothetical protein
MAAGVSLKDTRYGTTNGTNSGTHDSHELQTVSEIRMLEKDDLRVMRSGTMAEAIDVQAQCLHDEGASIVSYSSRTIMIEPERLLIATDHKLQATS